MSGRVPKADELSRLADHFGVTMEWLLHGREPQSKSEPHALRDAPPAPVYLIDDALAEVVEIKERISALESKLRKLKSNYDRH